MTELVRDREAPSRCRQAGTDEKPDPLVSYLEPAILDERRILDSADPESSGESFDVDGWVRLESRLEEESTGEVVNGVTTHGEILGN